MNRLDNLKKNLKTKDAQMLMGNFISLTMLQVVGYLFPLLTIPYLARVIGVDKFGEIAFAGSIMVYFQTIVDYGFNFTATRDIARNRGDYEKISDIFSTVMWARVFLLVLTMLILLTLILSIPMLYEMRKLLIFSFLMVVGYVFFPEWLFQGLERMKYITILNFVSKIIFTLAVFAVIKEKSDYIYQPLLTSFGFCIVGIISMYIIIVKWKIKIQQPSWKRIRLTLRGSTDVFINQLFPNLYNALSVLLVGVFFGSVANGLLDAGSKLANLAQQFLGVISRVFFPYLSRKIDKHSLFAKYYIGLSIFVSMFLFLAAPWLIRLFFTSEFYDAIIVLRIISLSGAFLVIGNVYGTNYLILQGQEKLMRNITIRSSVLGFCIAIPLVYYFSFIGAALTITITRILIGLSSFWAAKRVQKMSIETV